MAVYDLSQVLTTYGRYAITAKSTASGYEDSDVASLIYDIGATITIQGNTVTVTNVMSGVTSMMIYIDDEYVATENMPSEGTFTADLSSYASNYTDGKHSVQLRAVGEGIADNRSNAVTWFVGTAPIYGVSGLYDSSPALTRTDDAVDLDYVINSSSGSIDSDFDDVFPWSEAEVVNDTQGKMLKMPEMYFRVGVDGSGRITDVAVSSQPSGTGDWYKVNEFYYGCYGAANESSKLVSKTGKNRLYSQTRATFRTYAGNAGSGYCQLDLYHRTVMMFLWYIEWATKNSAAIMTGTVSGGRKNTGGTDSVSTPSGYNTSTNQMRYHYIEDFVGNLWEFVDGVCCSPTGTADYVTADVSKFSDDTTGKSQLSYVSPSNGCLAALGWDTDKPFLCMPHTVVNNGSYNTYFCDQAYNDGSSHPVLYCGAYCNDANGSYGLSYFYRSTVSNSYSGIGGRLLRVS